MGMLFGAGAKDCTLFIDNDRASAARADVNAQKWNGASL